MKKGTIGIIVSLMAFSMVMIGGCTTTYKAMKDWEGRMISDLHWDWGKADEVVDYGADGRVYTWYSAWEDDGQEKTCRKTFYAKNFGRGEEITDTSYENCPFFSIK